MSTGILEGGMIHLDETEYYLNSKIISVTNSTDTNSQIQQKIKRSFFYIQICKSIHTAIIQTLSQISSVHTTKLQTWHKRVQQHTQYNKYIDSNILSQRNDSNDAFLTCILYYESGKVLHMLGVTLAKKFSGDAIFVNRVCTNEIGIWFGEV